MMKDVPGQLDGGLDHRRYVITKTDGTPTSKDAHYFVLHYDKDPHAVVALAAYAESIMSDNPPLAKGILETSYRWAVELNCVSEWAKAANSLLYQLKEANAELRIECLRLRYDKEYGKKYGRGNRVTTP